MTPARIARTVAALLVAAVLVPAGAALADGDPASDVLLGQNVFYPYMPPVSATLQKQLNAETAAAAKAKFPIRVALIASPIDLGTIPELFGKPQQYADFLDQEISFQGKQPLLVVMAAGYGVQALPAASTSAAKTLAPPAGKTGNDLASAALTVVSKLASAAGHPIAGAGSGSAGSGSGGGSSALIVILLVFVAVLSAGALALITLRRRAVQRQRARQRERQTRRQRRTVT
jgi:hypothetical protein